MKFEIMKVRNIIAAMLLTLLSSSVMAQQVTVDEIVSKYLENIGGAEAWKKLNSMKMTASLMQQGMEIPIDIVRLADGRQYTKFEVQGFVVWQEVFDGETYWSTNFQTMEPEKSSAEDTENFKLGINDFPDAWIDYKKKGYSAELMGTQDIDGTDTYKVKLIREPLTIDGKEVESASYYFFDKESFMLVAREAEIMSGQAAGMVQLTRYSDYDKVNGLMFPFTLRQGATGNPLQDIIITDIEVNITVDDAAFAFPGGK